MVVVVVVVVKGWVCIGTVELGGEDEGATASIVQLLERRRLAVVVAVPGLDTIPLLVLRVGVALL